MKFVYPAIFYKEENGYSAVFADFECATQGEDLPETIQMAAEAAAGWIIGSIDHQEALPKASALETITPEDSGFVSLVYIDLDELAAELMDKPIKKTLTIPAWLNQAAERKNINFSATLKDALMEKLAQ